MDSTSPIDGSLRVLSRCTIPLMLSFLSMNLMIFFDRLFLSHFSIQALNDAVCSGNLAWCISFPWIILVDITEVFIARYNGSQSYQKLGNVVWQMIWFSVPIFLIFFIIGHFGSSLLFNTKILDSEGEVLYFRWNCYFVPLLTSFSAIASFYTGRGQTKIVAVLVISGNLINIVFDYLLIFGVKDLIPPLGLKGAIISTGLGVFFQITAIFYLFISKKNRKHYGSNKWAFDPNLIWKILKLGSPAATLVYFELFGWTLFLLMMKKISPTHILVVGIAQSISQLFLCFGTGLEQGVITITGNLLGSNKKNDEIWRLAKSGIILITVFSLVIAFFLIFFPDFLIDQFTTQTDPGIRVLLKSSLVLITIYLTLENIGWLLKGILIGAGDTTFLMKVGIACTWFFLVLPIYFFVFLPKGSVSFAFYIWIFYSATIVIFAFLRLSQKNWNKVPSSI